jgi:hypothetical protein
MMMMMMMILLLLLHIFTIRNKGPLSLVITFSAPATGAVSRE